VYADHGIHPDVRLVTAWQTRLRSDHRGHGI